MFEWKWIHIFWLPTGKMLLKITLLLYLLRFSERKIEFLVIYFKIKRSHNASFPHGFKDFCLLKVKSNIWRRDQVNIVIKNTLINCFLFCEKSHHISFHSLLPIYDLYTAKRNICVCLNWSANVPVIVYPRFFERT